MKPNALKNQSVSKTAIFVTEWLFALCSFGAEILKNPYKNLKLLRARNLTFHISPFTFHISEPLGSKDFLKDFQGFLPVGQRKRVEQFVQFELFLALQASPYVAERVLKKNLVSCSEDIRNKLS